MTKDFLNIRSSYLRSNHLKRNYPRSYKKICFSLQYKILNLSLNELKIITKSRRIKGYKSMSKERLSSVLHQSESVESQKNFDDGRIKRDQKRF